MTEKICPTCGTEYPANERFCPRDGSALRSQGNENDLVGSIIAERYHVMKKLGEGGMGQVYLAEHVKMGRKSAVKVMNPGMVNDADAISRFNREAANASRINHPNVAGIYDFGETSDGLIYLAMEFIEGQSLTSVVEKEGALDPVRAAEIIRQTAEGLQVAHDMGIVHRDLKPDNIMIAKGRNDSDLVKVVDFGIAKASGAENQKVTKTGLVVGTPEYMSPEQLAGDKLDRGSDIYSLGLVAFNVFTGKLPFEAETAQESMIVRLTEDPATLQSVKPDTSWTPEVQRVMKKVLERKRDDRYATAADFGNELSEAVARMPKQSASGGRGQGATVVAAPPATRIDANAVTPLWTPSVDAAPVKKSKTPLYAGGGVAVLAIAVAAFAMWPKAGTPANETGVTAKSQGTAQTPGGPAPSATQAANSSPVVRPGDVQTNKPSNAGSPPASNGASNISARLPILLEQSSDTIPAVFTRARREAASLMSKASEEEQVGLILVQAQAFAMADDTGQTCTMLRAIKTRSQRTQYLSTVSRLLNSC